MHTVSAIDVVTHTPFWVWAALVVVVWFGLRRARARDVTVSRLVLFPLVVAVVAISGLLSSGLGAASLEGFALGAIAGGVLAAGLERRKSAQLLPDGRLHIPAEWTSVAVVLAIFATRYAATVISLTDPVTAAGDGFHFAVALGSGVFCALMLVRTGLRLRTAWAAA